MFKKYLALVSQNWKSGITVGLVSIPLSLSLSVASGASPEAGLVTAAWAGLIAALFGGSNFNVVGPAGALTGVLLGFAVMFGPALLPMLAIAAGVIILVAHAFRLETYLVLVPKSVMYGFSFGVALTIAASQLTSAFGLEKVAHPESVLGSLFANLTHLHQGSLVAAGVFAASMALLFVFSRLIPKLPAALFVAPIGILVGYLSTRGIVPDSLMILSEKFPSMSFSLFHVTRFSANLSLLAPAMSVAFIAILETLISAKIADGMTHTKFNSRREVLGLGLANIFSGLFGGLPATGVFVRTGLNVKSGASHRISSLINALFVGLVSVLLFSTFTLIPMPVIAAILIFAAVRMVETRELAYVYNQSKREFVTAMLVAFLMLAIDSVAGLVFGIVIALLYYVKDLSKGNYEIIEGSIAGTDVAAGDRTSYTYKVLGNMSYLNADTHAEKIRELAESFKEVTIDMSGCASVDFDALLVLEDVLKKEKAKSHAVVMTRIPEALASKLLPLARE